MKILGIETSCDETAAAIVTDSREILAHRLLSQVEAHTPYQGVVPEIASRAHLEHVDRLVAEAMEDAGIGYDALDAVAVTAGPGLIGGVIVGVMLAKAIASVVGKPLVAVNHLEGHALTVRLTDEVAFPYLLLLASGGHCQWLLVEGVGKYRKLGGTIDDAMGEAFDKIAKMLGLGFPGGPAVERVAAQGDAQRFAFPLSLCDRTSCDFSFSGLKTAVRLQILALHEAGQLDGQAKADICASFQRTVVEIVRNRLRHALAGVKVPTLVVAGGVAANKALRGMLEEEAGKAGLRFVAPPLKLCTDNAAMIAWAGLERFRIGMVDGLDVKPRARWPLDEA